MKACLYCAEQIEDAAVTCPYCRSDVTGPVAPPPAPSPAAAVVPKSSSNIWVIVLLLAIGMIVLLACVGILAALLLPALQQARVAARRTQCTNNLKQIGLALHNYHDVYGTYPPAYVADEEGNPMHSWRVLILPYLGQAPLYEAYDFTEPWDSPANEFVLESMPMVFRCPSNDDPISVDTGYAAVFGPDCVFAGAEGIGLRDITDGTSNTLMVGEAHGAAIPWTKPQDVEIAQHPTLNDPDGLSSAHPQGLNVLFADGSVRFLHQSTNQETLQNLFQRNDGNLVQPF